MTISSRTSKAELMISGARLKNSDILVLLSSIWGSGISNGYPGGVNRLVLLDGFRGSRQAFTTCDLAVIRLHVPRAVQQPDRARRALR